MKQKNSFINEWFTKYLTEATVEEDAIMNSPTPNQPAGKVNIDDPANWVPAVKKEYKVQVSKPELGTKVFNKLEGSSYVTDEKRPYVITGTVGEQWPVSLEKLNKDYQQVSNGVFATKPSSVKYWVCQIPKDEQVQIKTSWGDTLTANRPGVEHGTGDFACCMDKGGKPDFADRWVINGAVFPTTYQITK